MISSHTPGPWKVGNGDIFADGNETSDFDDIVICAIGQSGGGRSHEYAVVKAHKPEGRANARLIAAAPELLEALKEIRRVGDDKMAFASEWAAAVAKADAAISKAEGRP